MQRALNPRITACAVGTGDVVRGASHDGRQPPEGRKDRLLMLLHKQNVSHEGHPENETKHGTFFLAG